MHLIYKSSIADAAIRIATLLNMTAACGALLGRGVALPEDEASDVPEGEASDVPKDEASAVLSGVEPVVVLPVAVALVESLVPVGVEVGTTEDVVVSVMPHTFSTSKVNGMFLSTPQASDWRFRESRYCQNRGLD